jgi:hypothetical protein
MHRSVPLTAEQIAELRAEVSKLLEANMDSFSLRASRASQLHPRDYDSTPLVTQRCTSSARNNINARRGPCKA